MCDCLGNLRSAGVGFDIIEVSGQCLISPQVSVSGEAKRYEPHLL